MNHRGSSGRYLASGDIFYRQEIESLVPVDSSFDESSGNKGRGPRGRGRSTTSWSPRDSSGRGGDEHSPFQVYVQNSSAEFVGKGGQQPRKLQEDKLGSTKKHDEGAASKFSGDNKDLLQSSPSSSSKSISLSRGLFVSKEWEDKDVKNGGARMRYDLVIQMKDVLLSCLDNVSSTSDQKVELSSVEDQISTAHKSGGEGNSSSECSTKPFDISPKKTGMVPKPSMLELNRAKRKAAKGYSGIVIRPGMVLLKNYLSINEQVMIVNKCRQLGLGEGGFYQPSFRNEAILHLKMMCLGKHWDCETRRYGETRPVDGSIPPQIPVEFSQLVEKAIQESQSLAASKSNDRRGEVTIPSMSPDICIVNFYTSTGRLGLHQDKGESERSLLKGLPIVSFSIGDSAEFLYGDQSDVDKAETLVLESGDVLIFGGRSRNVFHGVRSIRKDTAPKVLLQETSLRPGRLNLTFRQY